MRMARRKQGLFVPRQTEPSRIQAPVFSAGRYSRFPVHCSLQDTSQIARRPVTPTAGWRSGRPCDGGGEFCRSIIPERSPPRRYPSRKAPVRLARHLQERRYKMATFQVLAALATNATQLGNPRPQDAGRNELIGPRDQRCSFLP